MLYWMLFGKIRNKETKQKVLNFNLPAYEILGLVRNILLNSYKGNSRVFPRHLINPQWMYCRNKLNSLTHSKGISEPYKILQRTSHL